MLTKYVLADFNTVSQDQEGNDIVMLLKYRYTTMAAAVARLKDRGGDDVEIAALEEDGVRRLTEDETSEKEELESRYDDARRSVDRQFNH